MKTKDNCPSILSYFLPGTFPPFFFEFSTFNEERKKRQFRGNKNYLSFGVSETECSQNPAHMQWNAIFIAYVVQTGLFFLLLIFGHPYGGKIPGTRELSMPLFTWNMHFIWQHCGLLQKEFKLRMSHAQVVAGILKYP